MADAVAPIPLIPADDVDAVERGRRDLLTALLVERFTPYRPPAQPPRPQPAADDSSRKGAA